MQAGRASRTLIDPSTTPIVEPNARSGRSVDACGDRGKASPRTPWGRRGAEQREYQIVFFERLICKPNERVTLPSSG